MHPGSPTRWIITIAKLGSLPHAETSMDSSSTFKGPVLPLALFAFCYQTPGSGARVHTPYSHFGCNYAVATVTDMLAATKESYFDLRSLIRYIEP